MHIWSLTAVTHYNYHPRTFLARQTEAFLQQHHFIDKHTLASASNMRFAKASAAAALAALPAAFAQTSTDCDPTKKSCPADTGLPSSAYTADFTQGSSANASWSAAAYTTINYGQNGAEFTISGKNQAPTVQTDFYIFFGRIDVKMKAAPGQGIISSIVLESDDLDEIDWEFIGSNTQKVETNFFGKGNTTSYDRAIYYDVQTPQNTFHTYTIDWNADRLEFIIDGTTVRTLAYTDPLTNGGNNYPQVSEQSLLLSSRSIY